MTFGTLPRRLALLAALSSALWLAACGGGDDDNGGGQSNLRAVNLSTDLASVDLYVGANKTFSALAPDAMANNVGVEANTHTLAVKRAGEAATLYSDSFALTKDRHYTAVVTGRESGLLVRTIPEDEDTNNITAGNTRVRVFNLTSDTGGVDVFITTDTTDINDRQPDLRFTSNSLSDFIERSTGTYRLRVTSRGITSDVRLDIPLTGLQDKKFHTLVLTSGLGGALVNATLIPQGGTPTILKNTKARVRVVASMNAAGNVAVSVGGSTLVGGLRSPSVGPYTLVNAGNLDLTVRVNGNVISSATQSFAAGSDYTLMTYGTEGAGQVKVLADDNRLPSSASRVKVRLVHGLAGVDPLTLSVDYLALATDQVSGAASAYATTNAASSVRIDVTSASAAAALYSATEVNLQGQGVYTVFMLGGNASPTGVIRKER